MTSAHVLYDRWNQIKIQSMKFPYLVPFDLKPQIVVKYYNSVLFRRSYKHPDVGTSMWHTYTRSTYTPGLNNVFMRVYHIGNIRITCDTY